MASLRKRGNVYYAQYYVGERQVRVSLETADLSIAREKLRQIESARFRGEDIPQLTKTPLRDIVSAYVDHIKATRTKWGVRNDIWYLRDIFGVLCDSLQPRKRNMTRSGPSRKTTRGDARGRHIDAQYLEHITTAEISEFIASRAHSRKLAPKTANHYRGVLSALFNWAMDQRGVIMSGGQNPAAKVRRYKEKASEIRFLTLEQIKKQLENLRENTQLQTMVAVYIYAGLRREEALWLQLDDIDLTAGQYGMIRVQAKTFKGEYWEPKTKVNRAVPISRKLREYLDCYEPRIVPGHWYFSSPEGNRWHPDSISQELRRVNKKANLPWSCLDYRHTFGSQLAMKGESLYKISKLLGNSPEICRRHYAALIPEALSDSVEFDAIETPSGKKPRLRVLYWEEKEKNDLKKEGRLPRGTCRGALGFTGAASCGDSDPI